MKQKKPKRPAPGVHGSGRKPSRNRQLVWVDQRPLRRQAASECSREMARLERAKAEWKRFEVEDKGAFARWQAAAFGPLLSQLREVESALQEKEMLMREIDYEMMFGGASTPRKAYARVQKRRSDPPPAFDPQGSIPPPPWEEDYDETDAAPDEEAEEVLLFEEFLFFILGLDPDSLSKAEYKRRFAEFREHVLNKKSTRSESFDEPFHERAPEPPRPEKDRVKELYRLLVRRLHPDTRAECDAGVSALWHEVQEAYGQGNVERLEMLLAFTDIQSNAVGEQTTLFQMRAVLAELRRSYKALQKNLRDAKKDVAWNFSRRNTREVLVLEERMRYELEARLTAQAAQLRHLETLVAAWSTPRKTGGKPPGKKHAARKQAEFQF